MTKGICKRGLGVTGKGLGKTCWEASLDWTEAMVLGLKWNKQDLEGTKCIGLGASVDVG